MSDREIMTKQVSQCRTRYYFSKEDWVNHKDLKQFDIKNPERNCSCESPKLVNYVTDSYKR